MKGGVSYNYYPFKEKWSLNITLIDTISKATYKIFLS